MRGRAGSRIGGVPRFLAQDAIIPAPLPTVPGAVYFSSPRAARRRLDDTPLGSPLALIGGGPSQALTATLYSDADTLLAPLLAQQNVVGAVYFSAPRPAPRRRDDVLGSPAALLAAGQALAAALYTDTDAFFSPSMAGAVVVPGPVYFDAPRALQSRRVDPLGSPSSLLAGTPQALTAALYSDADAFFAPALAPGSVGLLAALYADTDTLFAPALTAGQVDLTASLYTDADTLFAPALSATYGLVAALYTDNDGYFSHALAAQYDLAATVYVDPETVFAPTLSLGAVDLGAALYTDADTLFAPSLDAAGSLVADLYTDPDAFYSATLAGQNVVFGAVYFSAQPQLRQQRLDQLGSPPSLLAGSAQTLFQVAIHADNDVFFGSSLAGGIQLPGRIGTTTRFMVNLGTMTSRQH